jgi:hypothetical protein
MITLECQKNAHPGVATDRKKSVLKKKTVTLDRRMEKSVPK